MAAAVTKIPCTIESGEPVMLEDVLDMQYLMERRNAAREDESGAQLNDENRAPGEKNRDAIGTDKSKPSQPVGGRSRDRKPERRGESKTVLKSEFRSDREQTQVAAPQTQSRRAPLFLLPFLEDRVRGAKRRQA